MTSNERILVCVYHRQNGDRLVKRGSQLAKLYQCPLYVLNVQTEEHDEEVSREADQTLSHWKELCSEQDATFMVKKSGEIKASDIVAKAVEELQITQLIIGYSALTRWQEVVRGSAINELLRRIKQVDLHVISLQEQRTHS